MKDRETVTNNVNRAEETSSSKRQYFQLKNHTEPCVGINQT